jgi:hypothetical protein
MASGIATQWYYATHSDIACGSFMRIKYHYANGEYHFCVSKNVTPRETRHITRFFSLNLKNFSKMSL